MTREQKSEQRARMLGTTLEDLLMVDFAPSSAALRAALTAANIATAATVVRHRTTKKNRAASASGAGATEGGGQGKGAEHGTRRNHLRGGSASNRDRQALLGDAGGGAGEARRGRGGSSRTTTSQDELTEDLAAMAKELRIISTVEGERLKADVVLGEALNDAADRNTDNLIKADITLQEQIASSGGWGVWLVLLFAILSFFAAMLLIKLTNR